MTHEKFVDIPGIIEVRWKSDDPDTFVNPRDLFDEQAKGLPDFDGKKNKGTTEQAFFTCILCQCDVMSIKTLRDHCNGRQHFKKALEKKYKIQQKEGRRRGSTRQEYRNRSRSPRTMIVKEEHDSRERGREENRHREWCEEKREFCGRPERYKDEKDEGQNMVKTPRDIRVRDMEEDNNVVSSTVTTTEEDDVKRLHCRVAHSVKSAMNKYFPGSEDFERKQYKIDTEELYTRLAKKLSHKLREKIKESYKAMNNINSLEGIQFTPDHEGFIKVEVDSYFEDLPLK